MEGRILTKATQAQKEFEDLDLKPLDCETNMLQKMANIKFIHLFSLQCLIMFCHFLVSFPAQRFPLKELYLHLFICLKNGACKDIGVLHHIEYIHSFFGFCLFVVKRTNKKQRYFVEIVHWRNVFLYYFFLAACQTKYQRHFLKWHSQMQAVLHHWTILTVFYGAPKGTRKKKKKHKVVFFPSLSP